MNKILFCTDLSTHSKNALHFSIEIAKRTHSKIIVVHGFYLPMPMPAIDPAFQPIPISIEETRDAAKEELNILCNEIQSYQYEDLKPIECEYQTDLGRPDLEILQEAENINPDLIVMGSRHVQGLWKIFETTTTKIIEKSVFPVLVVPENSSFKGFKNIVYATDFKEENEDVNTIIEFAKFFDSTITFLHINNPERPFADLKISSSFEKQLLDEIDYQKIQFESITGSDAIPMLEKYTREKEIDLLVMLRHNYSFFEKIFHKSTTKEIIFNSKIPVMVIR